MGGMVLAQEGTTSSFGKRFREVYSTALLIFCTVLICAAIFTAQTNLSSEVHPSLAFVVLVLALIWLSMVEGSQASLVGLPPVNVDLYKESHPTTYKIMQIVNKVRPGKCCGSFVIRILIFSFSGYLG